VPVVSNPLSVDGAPPPGRDDPIREPPPVPTADLRVPRTPQAGASAGEGMFPGPC
jgi:hypothetical protein